jgi:NADH-quinone oxidoreductase subunit M
MVFLPLIAWAVWIGVYPKPYFDLLEKPVQQIVERVRPGYYQGGAQAATAHPPLAHGVQGAGQ